MATRIKCAFVAKLQGFTVLIETTTWKHFGRAVVTRSLPIPGHRQARCYSQGSGLIVLHRQGLVVAS